MIVAAIAEANDCIVVTDSERGFAGLKNVNPLRAAQRHGQEAHRQFEEAKQSRPRIPLRFPLTVRARGW